MRIGRRAVLGGLLALPATQGAWAASGFASPARYIACADDRTRRHFAVGFDAAGRIDFQLPLPSRGHGFARHPAEAQCTVFARRPGFFACVIDLRDRAVAATIAPPPGHNFYGHGVYSADGTLLYICEHDDATGNGLIGVFDAARGYMRIGDFGAGGIGPHEILLMPDGKTLAVAIGGIQTDRDRDKLNIDIMDPSLVYLDAASGRLLEQVRPPREWHQLSIRHLDVDAHGRVAVAMQYEGDEGETVPLAAIHRRGEALRYLEASEEADSRLRHYLGDIAFDAKGATIATTSPVGSVVALWDAASGDYLRTIEASDGCGIAAFANGFLVAGGDGRLRQISENSSQSIAASDWLWDNHLCVA